MPSKAPTLPASIAPLPSLLSLQDTLKRHPEAQKPILEAEIARRETELVLLRSHRMLLSLQLWSALQTSFIIGFIFFSLGVALSGLVQVGKFVQRFDALNASLPTTVLTRGFQQQVDSMIPTSTVLEVANYIPFWDLKDATKVSMLVAVVVLTIRIVQGISHWRASRRLKVSLQTLEQEIQLIRQWLHAVSSASSNNSISSL